MRQNVNFILFLMNRRIDVGFHDINQSLKFELIFSRDRIRGAGKRCYTFLVGKPNVAKLANFPEIDVFVLVACPETSFPDTSDFFQGYIFPHFNFLKRQSRMEIKKSWFYL